MFFKIVKNDCSRKKMITFAVFVFITMSVILGASATNIIANLIQSMAQLKQYAMPSDITQMHLGEYSQEAIDRFVTSQKENIALQETMSMLNVEGKDISYSKSTDDKDFSNTMAGSIQDMFFVVQNKQFDFILNLNNEKLQIQKGEIAVPIYCMLEYGLEIGDTIRVQTTNYVQDFVISNYARDYEMSNSLTSSKRFVIHPDDYAAMAEKKVGALEYLIQFRLQENGDSQAVQTAYIEAGMPANGPNIEGVHFWLLNALSDMIVSMVIVLIGVLLIVIAAFCIRLTFLATIDDDMREIGVMKAMGISRKDIKKVYVSKYRLMSGAAGIVGYILSFAVVNLFSKNMKLYLSSDLSGYLKYFLSLVAPMLVYFTIVAYCKKVLKKIDKISAVEALRSNVLDYDGKRSNSLPLLSNRFLPLNIYMGFRDVWKRMKLYRLLLVIFIVCTFIIILPLNIHNTMNSPEFTTYMGIGKCDMRIDLRRTDSISEDFAVITNDLKQDTAIEKCAAYVTCAYQYQNDEGTWDYINIETGDFSVFPLKYLEGRAPVNSDEIALSYANASDSGLNKKVGDEVILQVDGENKTVKVCGVYQDVTNGGKTAKVGKGLPIDAQTALWYIIYVDLAGDANLDERIDYYRETYKDAQVNNTREYAQQTMGNINSQMRLVVVGGFAVAILIAVLITTLYVRMLLSKDMAQNEIMQSIGVTSHEVTQQYMASTLLVLTIGVLLGIPLSNYLGEILTGFAMSFMGASRIEFVHIWWQTGILCPLILLLTVGTTIVFCCRVTQEKDLSVILRS